MQKYNWPKLHILYDDLDMLNIFFSKDIKIRTLYISNIQ